MSRAILLPVQPKWVAKILSGEKTIDARKTRPKVQIEWLGRSPGGIGRRYKEHHTPIDVYIYCTNSKDRYFLQKKEDGRYAEIASKIFTKAENKKLFADEILNGKVLAKFRLNRVFNTCGWRLKDETGRCRPRMDWETDFPKNTCLSIDELIQYAGSTNRNIFGWKIDDLQIFDKPKELREFGLERAPQSWCYVEVGAK